MLLSGRDWDRTAMPGRTLVHQSLRDTHVKHRQCPALSPGNAAGSITRLRAKGWMGEPKIMYVSAVCQGRLPWVWEKLGCFASLTLEEGDELIKPLRNWSSVTFTLDQCRYIFNFMVSKTLWSRRAHLECCTETQLLGSSHGASQDFLVHGELLLPPSQVCLSDVAVRCFPSSKSWHFWATYEYLHENKLPSYPLKVLWGSAVILLTQSRHSE